MSGSAFLQILRLLDASPYRTQREMARELGMSLGKANYLTRALLAKGFVKVHNFKSSTDKRAYAYLLTTDGVRAKTELAKRFLILKTQEYDALSLEIQRLRDECAVEP